MQRHASSETGPEPLCRECSICDPCGGAEDVPEQKRELIAERLDLIPRVGCGSPVLLLIGVELDQEFHVNEGDRKSWAQQVASEKFVEVGGYDDFRTGSP